MVLAESAAHKNIPCMVSSFWPSAQPFLAQQATRDEKDEMTAESDSHDALHTTELEGPVSLEGTLHVRKSGYTSWSWKRRFVYFNFNDGGSISIYKESPEAAIDACSTSPPKASSTLRTAYSRLHASRSSRDQSRADGNLELDITADLPWISKDVENDPLTFVVEIPSNDAGGASLGHSAMTGDTSGTYLSAAADLDFADDFTAFASDDDVDDGDENDDSISLEAETLPTKQDDDLLDELRAIWKKGKSLRIYFRCGVDANEKALWLNAFLRIGRLSREVHRRKKTLLGSFTASMHLGTSRIRKKANEHVAREARHLDLSETPADTDTADLTNDVELLARGGKGTLKDKEFRVLPTYSYPHRWLTKAEMREEMVLPSEHFHDLRVSGCTAKEIGTLKVEVLQCLGLPKLDRGSDTDAMVYLVCGAYAFATDVIDNRTNPMWLRKTRRACIFPLFHGYARLYVGVFDYEPRRVKDDFAGRVTVDLARLRPRSTYDVTLPLRLSTHVYSRRKRGAVRLRFTLNWHSERDAMFSYFPKSFKIPLPQHSKPNFETTVMCSDQKAFRNIAITVHGAHLPGRFTFNQMRAALREINFTRKFVFTSLRQVLRETRQWQNPAMSAFVFLSWMHCVYANSFSLVPAYTMVYFLLFLMQNYAKYCTDAPGQRGFIPPSWEELFMALVRGGDPEFHSIEPLELGVRHARLTRSKSPDSTGRSGDDFGPSQYKVATHKPRGQKLLQALGFLSDRQRDPNEDHLEFPFADGRDYPKFSVRECLVRHTIPAAPGGVSDDGGSTIVSGISDGEVHRNGVISRFPLDMDIQRMMRKDSSGTKDFDEEENNFHATRAVMSQGNYVRCTRLCRAFLELTRSFAAVAGRKAASKVSKTATALSSKTGLDYVVRPLQSGISSGVGHVSSSVGHMSTVAGTMTSHVMNIQSGMRRRNSMNKDSLVIPSDIARYGQFEAHDADHMENFLSGTDLESTDSYAVPLSGGLKEHGSPYCVLDEIEHGSSPRQGEKLDPALVYPEQNIDIQGPSNGKKLTDDLAEIKDKMHELTWHLFDDHTYVIKNPDAVFFGDAKNVEKRRKKPDPAKQLNKYLHTAQYSHTNPFVSRVGLYVEPIIGSTYSLLCLFRAGFNVVTWRDPILTFWLSLFCGIIAFVLFLFPWRIVLFLVGFVAVGPQNWVIRVLREQGHLPPNQAYTSKRADEEDHATNIDNPLGKPVFTKDSRRQGNDPHPIGNEAIEPREIHHVVVPYGPLVYQRCMDWPPEPEYAQVKREVSTVSSHVRRNVGVTRELPTDNQRVSRLRKRFRRSGNVSPDQGLPPRIPERNRMDTEET